VRYGCEIADGRNSQSRRLQGANCRLSAGARALDENVQLSDAHIHRLPGGLLTRKLCRVRRALARTLEARSARAAPRDHVAIGVRDRNDRVVESRLDVCLCVGNVPTHTARSTSLDWSSCHLTLLFRKSNLPLLYATAQMHSKGAQHLATSSTCSGASQEPFSSRLSSSARWSWSAVPAPADCGGAGGLCTILSPATA
jgi:hypothetical protein